MKLTKKQLQEMIKIQAKKILKQAKKADPKKVEEIYNHFKKNKEQILNGIDKIIEIDSEQQYSLFCEYMPDTCDENDDYEAFEEAMQKFKNNMYIEVKFKN